MELGYPMTISPERKMIMKIRTFGKRALSMALAMAMVFGMFGGQVTIAGAVAGEGQNAQSSETALTVNGQANAAILLPEDASYYEKMAAQELQDHIALVSGAWMPIDTQGTSQGTGALRYILKEETITARQMGYYPFAIVAFHCGKQTGSTL